MNIHKLAQEIDSVLEKLCAPFTLHTFCVHIPPFYATVMLVSDLFAFAVFLIYTSHLFLAKKAPCRHLSDINSGNFFLQTNTALVSKPLYVGVKNCLISQIFWKISLFFLNSGRCTSCCCLVLSIVLCSLRVSHFGTLFHQLLMEYFKLENRFRCIFNELKHLEFHFWKKCTSQLFCLLKVLVLGWLRPVCL